MSSRLHGRREGDRSEYYALTLLSALGLTVPIPRQEDTGFDFHCNLADQETGVLTLGSPFLVNVKSLSEPDIELEPTEAQKRDNDQRHIEWLFRSDMPAFLVVMDKKPYIMRLYSLMSVWFLCYKGGAESAASRWSARVLTGYSQPWTREENEPFLMATFDPGDVFDFSDPKDVEEYRKVYQPIKRAHMKRPSRGGPGYREANN